MQALQAHPAHKARIGGQSLRGVQTKPCITRHARVAPRVVAVHRAVRPRLSPTCSSDREPVVQQTGPARQIGQKLVEYAKHGAKAVAVLGVAVLLVRLRGSEAST